MAMEVLFAVGFSSRSLRISFRGGVPKFQSPIGVGDGSNPSTYTVTDTTTSEALKVVGVRMLAPYAPALPVPGNTLELLLSERFKLYRTFRVQCSGILDSGGAPIGAPDFYDFTASPLKQTIETINTPKMVDLASVPQLGEVTGSLKIAAGGDYEKQAGTSLLKKLIIRRLVTELDGFTHMQGYGETLRAKGFFTTGHITTIKAEVAAIVQKEPEIEASGVSVTFTSQGVLMISVQGKLRTGEAFNVRYSQPST